MRILIIHNFYNEAGGEDQVFKNEFNLLRREYDVDSLTFTNARSRFRTLLNILFMPLNLFSLIRVISKIKKFKPDVVHVHNFHYEASPSIFLAAQLLKVPVVHTLHNYRLICPSATLYTSSRGLYFDSLQRTFPFNAVIDKVYKGSSLLTFWLAFTVWFHKTIGTWNRINTYITLTETAKNLFLRSSLGLKPQQIQVKPNFVISEINTLRDQSDFYLFVGRLTAEKGVATLLEAFRKNRKKLLVIGNGNLSALVLESCKDYGNIVYLGMQPHSSILTHMSQAKALIFPSIWYEGMPMTILESLSTGTPIIASNLGAMKEIIQDDYNGFKFEPGSSEDLIAKVNKWDQLKFEDREVIRRNCKRDFLNKFTDRRNAEMLNSIYYKLTRDF